MRIAVAQLPGAALVNWRETLALIDELVGRAAAQGAELVVLPECSWPAYYLGSATAYREARAGGIPGSRDFLDFASTRARRTDIAICAGFVEEEGGGLFNSACLIDRTGQLLGVRRKCFLWDFDHQWFTPGKSIAPIDTAFGPVGLMICADARLPEIPATLATCGARLILQPTAWVNAGSPERLFNPQPEFMIPVRARECGVPIASASKWGVEGSTTFVGMSVICGPDGCIVAQAGSYETTVIVADVQLQEPRVSRLTEVERRVLGAGFAPVYPAAEVPLLHLCPLPVEADPACIGPSVLAVADGYSPQGVGYGTSLTLAFTYRAAALHARCACGGTGESQCKTVATANTTELAGLRLVTARADEVRGFSAIRRAALLGAHLVLVLNAPVEIDLLRTRACENRIFMLAASPSKWLAIGPTGEIIAGGAWPDKRPVSGGVHIEPWRAADKSMAPGTEVFAGRRPSQYSL